MSSEEFDVAIVGISGEFPGANNVNELWQLLVAGDEALTRLTEEDMLAEGISAEEFQKEGYVPVCGRLNDIKHFDSKFFGYSSREASLIDPQQRKALEHAWYVLEDAAINPEIFEGNIGVFASSSLNTYLLNNVLPNYRSAKNDDVQQILFSNGLDYMATRIAYQLNLRGPAINIQTACSSSLVAVHEAYRKLLSYEVDAAIAGGVSISCPQNSGHLYSVDGILSPDGHCRAFSEQAEGTVFSSGVGFVALKRLADARENNDHIYAVIKGAAINNDGQQKMGYAAPSIDGQAEVVAHALQVAELEPSDISYIETHGTGTQLGDPVEISALSRVFTSNNTNQKIKIGSLKSNLGHLDTASGVAGLIKVCLAMKHNLLPKSLHCEQPSKKIEWDKNCFAVNTSNSEWQRDSEARFAGVSSFGIGGTNAHVILGQASQAAHVAKIDVPALLPLSAKSKTALQRLRANLLTFLKANLNVDIHSVSRTLQTGRANFAWREALVVDSVENAISILSNDQAELIECTTQREVLDPGCLTEISGDRVNQLAQQWLSGHRVHWHQLYTRLKPALLSLPGYPFERTKHWIEPIVEDQNTKQMDISKWFYLPSWKRTAIPDAIRQSQGNHRVLVVLNKGELHQHIASAMPENVQVIYAYASTQLKDDDVFSLDVSNSEHWYRLFSHLEKEGQLPTHLIHTTSFSEHYSHTDIEEFKRTQPHGLLSLVALVKAWEHVVKDAKLNLTIVTNRLNRIAAETRIEPFKSPVLAAVKVIPKEYVNIQTQLVDMDCADQLQVYPLQVRRMLVEAFTPIYTQEEVVFRGIERWVRDYTQVNIDANQKPVFRDDRENVVVITGGLGLFGLDIADFFASKKNVKLALLSRSILPDESEWPRLLHEFDEQSEVGAMIRRVGRIRESGVIVNSYQCDVGVAESLASAVAKVEQEMGAVTGVVHAAGETVNGILSLKTEESLAESYHAKVYGTINLYRVFEHKHFDFMILCSSMNAIIGGLGQLDNTAANSFIDFYAEKISFESGKRIFSINWGAVNIERPLEVNVVKQFENLSREHKKNRMTDDEVSEVYTRILTHEFGARMVISTIDFGAVWKNWNRVASIKELNKEKEAYKNVRMSRLTPEDLPQTPMELFCATLWKDLLGLDEVGLPDNFFEYGGNSLTAVHIMTKLKEIHQLKVHVMELYERPTLGEFSDYVSKLLQVKMDRKKLTH